MYNHVLIIQTATLNLSCHYHFHVVRKWLPDYHENIVVDSD